MANRPFGLQIVLLLLVFLLACPHSQGHQRAGIQNSNAPRGPSGRKVLIVYQSKYGSTEQYARWLQTEIPGDLANIEENAAPPYASYDVIVFGSPVRMGRIILAPVISDAWTVIRGKKVVLYSVSGTPPQHPNIQKIYARSLPEGIRSGLAYFPLRGRISNQNLSWLDRLLVALGRAFEKDETLKAMMGQDYDEVKRESLAPLVQYLRAQM